MVLSVAVDGTPPVGYHWRKDGQFLSGETKAMLVLANVSPTDSGTYSVLVQHDTPAGLVSILSNKVRVSVSP